MCENPLRNAVAADKVGRFSRVSHLRVDAESVRTSGRPTPAHGASSTSSAVPEAVLADTAVTKTSVQGHEPFGHVQFHVFSEPSVGEIVAGSKIRKSTGSDTRRVSSGQYS